MINWSRLVLGIEANSSSIKFVCDKDPWSAGLDYFCHNKNWRLFVIIKLGKLISHLLTLIFKAFNWRWTSMTTTCTWMFTTRLSGTHMHISAASAVIDLVRDVVFVTLRFLSASAFSFYILVLGPLPTYLWKSIFIYIFHSACVSFFLSLISSVRFPVSICFLFFKYFSVMSLFYHCSYSLHFSTLRSLLSMFLFVSGLLVCCIKSFYIQYSYAYFYYSESLLLHMLFSSLMVCVAGAGKTFLTWLKQLSSKPRKWWPSSHGLFH